MKSFSSLLALTTLSAAAPNPVQAPRAETLATSTKADFFLPPAPTGDAQAQDQQNIWASVLTSDASATEYLLACETAFDSPSDCEGPYTGVTLTHGAATMAVQLDGTNYACSHGDGKDAVCAIKSEDGPDEATTLAPAEAKKWSTQVTVVAEPTLPAQVDEGVNAAKGRGGSSGGGRRKGGSGGGGSYGDDEDDGVGSLAVSWGVLAAAAGIAALM